MKTDYFKPNCPYANNCSSKGINCQNCRHNKNKKEDHYEPIPFRPIMVPGTTGDPWWFRPMPITCYLS